MAVTKIWAIHDSVSRVVDYCTNPSKTKLSDLEQVLLYAADKEKTLDEGEQQYAVTGIGCRAESAAREMAAVQRRFGKAGGNVAYHAYQSFKTGEVTAEECHRIGVETERLLEASKDHPYSLLIQMTAFYGLRRSEALGLKWDAIDFERDTITIKHIVTNAKIDGKCEIVCADRAKTKSSLRSLPLVSNIREKLLVLREQQKENRRVCGNCYSKKYDGYVFVDAMGNIFNPRSVTTNFSKLLEQNGLGHIRFHDLRHSCASLLLANDVPLKHIQEWLGHSDFTTTANIYAHLDYKSKITSANEMDNILTLPDTRQTGWHT